MLKLQNMFEQVLNEAKTYQQIVFLDKSQDFSSFRGSGGKGEQGFFDSDEKEMAQYLSQWDYGDGGEEYSGKFWGNSDDTTKINIPGAGKYFMTYNSRLGYAGLYLES